MRTASAAYVLSKQFTGNSPDEAMLAGLIHDIGAFYMLYRASQYEELCNRPDTVKYLIIQWHEDIGQSLLDALGMPQSIVVALKDHDQPRVAPTELRNLADVIYVANMMAGGVFEWRYMEIANDDSLQTLDAKFTSLIPEIDQYEKEISDILS